MKTFLLAATVAAGVLCTTTTADAQFRYRRSNVYIAPSYNSSPYSYYTPSNYGGIVTNGYVAPTYVDSGVVSSSYYTPTVLGTSYFGNAYGNAYGVYNSGLYGNSYYGNSYYGGYNRSYYGGYRGRRW